MQLYKENPQTQETDVKTRSHLYKYPISAPQRTERMERKQCLYRYLKPGQNAGLLGVGGVTSGARHAAEALGFRVKSVPDTNHATHLTGS